MLLHLGQDTVVNSKDIVAIFDLDTTTVSMKTREFLASAEKSGRVVNVSMELPKSFVLVNQCGKSKIYISQLSSTTLVKRFESGNQYLEIKEG